MTGIENKKHFTHRMFTVIINFSEYIYLCSMYFSNLINESVYFVTKILVLFSLKKVLN